MTPDESQSQNGETGHRVRGGWRLGLALAASGAASLMYQVAWTRALCALTSATATAQAAILAAFMAGLGIGSALAGQFSRRLRFPLAGYALAEAAAAVLSVLGLWLIAALSRLGAYLESPDAELANPLWWQLLLAGVYFFLPTTLLGASLPLLLAHVQRATGTGPRRGMWMGLLYGLNTAGAVAGTLFSGFFAVEHLGLRLTAVLGGALALLAGGLALWVQFAAARPAQSESREPILSGHETPLGGRFILAAALAGGVGLGCEVVWTRLLSVVMINTVHAFTLVLAAVLSGISLGGLLAGRLARRHPDPARLRRLLSGLLLGGAILAAAVPLLLLALVAAGFRMQAVAQGELLRDLLALLWMLVPPAALNAAALPLLAAASAAPDGSRAFGRLYGINTAGGILGSLLSGFVLLPLLGSHATLTVLSLGSLLAALLVLPPSSESRRIAWAAAGTGALLLAPLVAFSVPRQIMEGWLPPGESILELREGVGSDAMVTRTAEGQFRLWINSSWHSTTLGARHRLLGHIPALFCEKPRRMLGIAMGSGQTFAAALRHGPERFDAVEIDPNIIELAPRYFNEVTGGFFRDPRVRLHHADGRTFLRALRRPVDLIVLEPSQTWAAGMTTLYTREFYQDARARLDPDGVMAQMIPFYGQTPESLRAMVATALDEFPHAMLWQDQLEGILLLSQKPLRLDPDQLRLRVRERGVGPDLRQNHLVRASDLLSLFLMGEPALRAWTAGASRVTDDRPFLEFDAARVVGQDLKAAIAQDMRPWLEDPARYAASGADPEVFAEARAVRDTLDALSEFRAGRDFASRAERLEAGLALAPGAERLRGFYRAEILLWARSILDADPARARSILMRGLDHLPDFAEAGLLIALIELRSGRADAARDMARRFEGFERTRPMVEQFLRQIDAAQANSPPAGPTSDPPLRYAPDPVRQ